MRVIGGILRGRRFSPPADKWPTRPTTDIAREGLFNMIQHSIDFEHVSMLDIFGGTGSHSYEFYSRGCRNITYVDRHLPCIKFVKTQFEVFGASDFVRLIKSDFFKFVRRESKQYDYIFAGPPYPLETLPDIPKLIFEHNLLAEEGLFVLEHDSRNNFEDHPRFFKSRNYGETIFSFFQ